MNILLVVIPGCSERYEIILTSHSAFGMARLFKNDKKLTKVLIFAKIILLFNEYN